MSGWGRFRLLVGGAVLVALGCGSRTDALRGELDGEALGGEGGSTSQAGTRPVTPGRGGSGQSVTGGSGSIPVAGSQAAGFGGVYTGGYGAGGFVTAGAAIAGYGGSVVIGGYGGGIVGGFGGIGVAGEGGAASCRTCLIESCAQPASACLQDLGCISILSCVQTSGCEPFQCYSPEYCQGTIDQWGGPGGESMSALLQALTCAVISGCDCN